MRRSPTLSLSLSATLLALAAGAFGIGVNDFSPRGLLPVNATDLGVSIPTAGLLISAYAVYFIYKVMHAEPPKEGQ